MNLHRYHRTSAEIEASSSLVPVLYGGNWTCLDFGVGAVVYLPVNTRARCSISATCQAAQGEGRTPASRSSHPTGTTFHIDLITVGPSSCPAGDRTVLMTIGSQASYGGAARMSYRDLAAGWRPITAFARSMPTCLTHPDCPGSATGDPKYILAPRARNRFLVLRAVMSAVA